MQDLKDIRLKITEVDNKMAELFRERMELVAKVAEYKKICGLPILDREREEQVLINGAARIDDVDLKSYYVSFLKGTMELSRRYQSSIMEGLKVAYCGTRGAFAHIAASKIFPSAIKVAYTSFKKAYDAVESGECDCAVLPIENSFAGDVGQVNDLMFSGSLFVNGMYDLPVTHDLLGVEGATIKDIKTVVSHPQALSQCSVFIKGNELKEIEYSNTALAAEYVKTQNDKSVAAVASEESAKLFGLEVVARSINDDRSNTTRFAVFSRSDNRALEGSSNQYFSLLFTARNEAGSLAHALTIIGNHGFNMRTLRSRPMKDLLWQYYFYIEAEGDIYGEDGRQCLEELKECCDRIKVVGSYSNLHSQDIG
ncbi:MAG: prephenate dehydratase domain-containing protein [Firmicutes bacterium]|nr:prephenate dehydratase domain-containing protein [Bacillota bacterium]